ncbi:MAG: glycosyltransferase [Acidobacteriota bacterium]|jgi:ceramide glucosyltransferase
MGELVLVGLLAVGLGARVLMVVAQRRHLRTPPPTPATELPAVSILKPVKGLDADLEANLRSVFAQRYPAFEVIIGAYSADDPALEVARRVAAAFPEVPSVVVADPRQVGPNPKVANLANLLRHARHEVVLISDSNVRVAPDYLADLVDHLQQPGVELVSSPIRGCGAASLGGKVDALLLNTFVMGGVAAVHRLFAGVCVVGKSMLLRRSTLRQIGGFEFLAQFLAEDQVCGQEVARRGYRIALSSRPIDNVTGGPSLRQVAARYLRWGKIRRRISPAGFAGELLLNPVAVAAVGAVALGAGVSLVFLPIAWVTSMGLNTLAERSLGVRRSLGERAALTLLADLLAAAVWPVALLARTVSWRGNALRIGPRTRLLASGELEALPELQEASETS